MTLHFVGDRFGEEFGGDFSDGVMSFIPWGRVNDELWEFLDGV